MSDFDNNQDENTKLHEYGEPAADPSNEYDNRDLPDEMDDDVDELNEFFKGELVKKRLDNEVEKFFSIIRTKYNDLKILAEENGVKLELIYLSKNKDERVDFQKMFPSEFHLIYDSLDED